MSDILDAIDTALGCQRCGRALDSSVSNDFCGEVCQTEWHARRAQPLPVEVSEPEPLRYRLQVPYEFTPHDQCPEPRPVYTVRHEDVFEVDIPVGYHLRVDLRFQIGAYRLAVHRQLGDGREAYACWAVAIGSPEFLFQHAVDRLVRMVDEHVVRSP